MDDFAKSLIGVLADTLDKNPSELEAALIASTNDGEVSYKPESEVKSYFKTIVENRLKEVASVKSDQFRQRGRKEAYESVESALKEQGVEFETWKDAIPKLIEKGKAEVKANPSDVKNSEIYMKDVQTLRDQLKAKDEEIEKVKSEWDGKFTNRIVKEKTLDIIKNKDNAFVLPRTDSVFNRAVNDLVGSLNSVKVGEEVYNVKLKSDNGEIKVLNAEDNTQIIDGYNPVTFRDLVLSTAKTGFFDVQEGEGRSSPGAPKPGQKNVTPGSTQKNVLDLGDGKTLTVPQFKDKKEYKEYYFANRGTMKPNELQALREYAKENFSEQAN